MYDHTHFFACKSPRAGIKSQVKWANNMVIADGHLSLPLGFVWVCMRLTLSLYHPWGQLDLSRCPLLHKSLQPPLQTYRVVIQPESSGCPGVNSVWRLKTLWTTLYEHRLCMQIRVYAENQRMCNARGDWHTYHNLLCRTWSSSCAVGLCKYKTSQVFQQNTQRTNTDCIIKVHTSAFLSPVYGT